MHKLKHWRWSMIFLCKYKLILSLQMKRKKYFRRLRLLVNTHYVKTLTKKMKIIRVKVVTNQYQAHYRRSPVALLWIFRCKFSTATPLVRIHNYLQLKISLGIKLLMKAQWNLFLNVKLKLPSQNNYTNQMEIQLC
jgi:hypothetical protein